MQRSAWMRRVEALAIIGGLSVWALGATRPVEPVITPALGTRALCGSYGGLPAGFGRAPYAGMLRLMGGSIVLGSSRGYREERPGGEPVEVAPFWIDRTEVTNAQFAAFVAATGYRTLAEQRGSAPVFHAPSPQELQEREYAWWTDVAGANWRHPEGPGSDLRGRAQHPVVQVAYADALAYARWLGRELPSEAQWEYAAKAGRTSEDLHREPRDAAGKPHANFWQGEFPTRNLGQDGFATAAPVGCFAPNPFGLFDTLGNVWEWTRDGYTLSHRREDAPEPADPAGCSQPADVDRLVIKGGSFLCSRDYCARYRVAARHAQEAGQPSMHLGFRTVRSQ